MSSVKNSHFSPKNHTKQQSKTVNKNQSIQINLETNDDLYPYFENENSTPNKIQKNFCDIILTKGLISQTSHFSLSNQLIKCPTNSIEFQEKSILQPLKLNEEDNSLEINSIIKLEIEEQPISKLINKSPSVKFDETEVKSRKKFSSEFFNDRKRPGYPTLTQKKRDLAPLLELEGIETTSCKDHEFSNYEDSNLRKSDEKPINYMINELEKIERLKSYKTKMEKFVILFNSKPQDGINYLIENKIKTTEEDIADILLTYEGLSKEMLGQYFGSPNAYNQEIFNFFCSFLDFSKLELDQALRLLLSRFRLPGEAQQIDRIVQTFSKKYMLDNPPAFSDEDTPYILSYSAIMLSTDAHSKTIQKKNKMKKHQFVENNKKICPSVTIEFLEGMFDRIVSKKFETQIDGFFKNKKN